jgi:hypothetical protein
MGDRGNLVVRQTPDTNRDDVWLYTHWRGSDIPRIVRDVLAKRIRWYDPTYFTRIAYDVLTENAGPELGFGIGTSISDNEHDIVVIDLSNELIRIAYAASVTGRLPDDLAWLPMAVSVPFETWITSDVEGHCPCELRDRGTRAVNPTAQP